MEMNVMLTPLVAGEGARRGRRRRRTAWKNKPDSDSEEREMEMNVMLTPIVEDTWRAAA